jgi:PAS domain S-box-containing protein
MAELDELRRELASLRHRNEQFSQLLSEARQELDAFAQGEVDAVANSESATPILLEAAQEQLRGSQRLLRAVFDGALDAMLLTDDSGKYVDANQAACDLFGLGREALIGRSIAELSSPDYDAEANHRALQEAGRKRGRLPLFRPDGTRRVLDYSAVANVARGLHLLVLRDITHQVDAEDTLRRSEARFRALTENGADTVWVVRADGTIRYLGPSISRVLGFTAEEMTGRHFGDYIVAEDAARVTAEHNRLVQGAREKTIEFRMLHRDGSVRWIEASARNLLDDPNVGGIVANFRDITARVRAEQASRESLYRLEEAQAIAHIGSWTSLSGPNDEILLSRECRLIFGIADTAALTGAEFFSYVDPDDRERALRACRDAFEFDTSFDLAYRIARPDGTVRWVHGRAIVEREAPGQPGRMIGTVQDITDRHFADVALRASEERYRRIVENTSEGVWMYDAEAKTTFMNARMAQMLGYAVDEVIGQPIYRFMNPSHVRVAQDRIDRRRSGIVERSDFPLQRKDGTPIWVSIQANPLIDGEGRFEGALSLVRDITAQRLADETRAHLAAIVEFSEDAILGLNLDGTITSWNLGAEKLYGFSAAEKVGSTVFALIPSALMDEERQLLRRIANGEAIHQHETTRLRKDDSSIEVGLTMSPIRDASGAVLGISKIARDLTARRRTEAALRRTEEQFRQAQKMEGLGRLAGGVAHDFNNLLSVILSYSELSIMGLNPADPLRADLAQVQKAAQRAAGLTRQLLAFSRQQVLEPRVIDLNQILAGMKPMLGRLLGEDIELALLPEQRIGHVLADPGQIEQVAMNLAVNARDAMPDGGILTIETANVLIDAADLSKPPSIAPGLFVLLAVSDTGTGMAPATLARIFEPFFTTKEQGKGTGLGLATVFGIVQQSGGFLTVRTEPGHGSTFRVYLPRTDRAAETSVTRPPPNVLHGSETILLVEDEDQVRTVACAILRRHGYHVLETSNGGEAFLVASDFPSEIHLLLSDVVMPRMSGRKLAEWLAPLRPKMKVLFASGYTGDAIIHHGVLDGVAFLQKPFTPHALLTKVREVLDA